MVSWNMGPESVECEAWVDGVIACFFCGMHWW